MEKQLTLRVRPGEVVRFPASCVACGQPAGEHLTLQKRRGQLTRRLDAPLCADCARKLARRSGQEERLLRLSWPAAAGVALLLTVLGLLVLPFDAGWLRLLVGLAFGATGGALIRWALLRRAEAAELPEKRAVREAARIVDFSWRDMTLAFATGGLAERVRALNENYATGDESAGEGLVGEPGTATEKNAPPAEDITV